jgi:hypothetical protein
MLEDDDREKCLRICLKTEGLTRIYTDETDLETVKNQKQQRTTGVLPLRQAQGQDDGRKQTAPKRPSNGSF